MTEEEKLRRQQFRAELEAWTVKFAADVHRLIQNVHGGEFKNFRFQIGKSSTSIGANYHEANRAESVTDFIHKIGIALKEAEETVFWLRYLIDILPELEGANVAFNECTELVKILQTIKTKTQRRP